METLSLGELSDAHEECVKKLSGELNLTSAYFSLDEESGQFPEEIRDYFAERSKQIVAGEDTWMSMDLTSENQRVFDFYRNSEVAGRVKIDFTTDEIWALNKDDKPIIPEAFSDLVQAVAVVEG